MKIVLDDQQLAEINVAFRWLMRQTDEAGRSIGADRDFPLIDDRLALVLERMSLAGLQVLEPGCLDGHVTVALCAAGATVTAFDARPICLVKSFARCMAFGYYPRLLLHDARRLAELGGFDVICHFGVSYHLSDPVAHLRSIARLAPVIALDTHTYKPGMPLDSVSGYQGGWYSEFGWRDQQSGLEAGSFWLTKAELRRLFSECGFACEVLRDNDLAPCGPRSLYLLRQGGTRCTRPALPQSETALKP